MTEMMLTGIGQRVSAHRRAAGVTQAELASRVGRSVQWVSAVEQGRRHTDRLSDLLGICSVLGCSLDDLLGRPIDSLTPWGQPQAAQVEATRAAILRTASPTASSPSTATMSDVARRVNEAWSTWHTSPTAHTQLGGVLPDLILDAVAVHRHADAGTRPDTAQALAGTWQIVRQWLHHLPEGQLAWIVAERALSSAAEAGDPRLIALGAWAMSASYRRAGQLEEATRLCLGAADELRPRMEDSPDDRELVAAFGMLNLAAAVSAAQSDEEGQAWALHKVAEDTARSLGMFYDPWTRFGVGNVDIHALAIMAELGRPDDVVQYSGRLDLDRIPSVERRARALIDTARGFVQRGDDEAAALVLEDAERQSTDEVRYSSLVSALVRELVHRDRARARPHVRKLAKTVGLVQS
ncbi:MAG: helix-turn-helix transcriptional regulator [Pseudonocardia sp.]|nr:helix-turn-helix transcriptional regulator [Pseudonocardia sp.]